MLEVERRSFLFPFPKTTPINFKRRLSFLQKCDKSRNNGVIWRLASFIQLTFPPIQVKRLLRMNRDGYQDRGLCKEPIGNHSFWEARNISTDFKGRSAKSSPPATIIADSSFYFWVANESLCEIVLLLLLKIRTHKMHLQSFLLLQLKSISKNFWQTWYAFWVAVAHRLKILINSHFTTFIS